MEREGQLVFVPVGGAEQPEWSSRLAPLGIPEFHLLDRDVPPKTALHQAFVDAVNRRPECVVLLTGKRSMENYIHPQAIFRARGLRLGYGPHDDVAELVARRVYTLGGGQVDWTAIQHRKRHRIKNQAKRWLNTEAVAHMTTALLDEQDPRGDVRGWIAAIGRLARTRS